MYLVGIVAAKYWEVLMENFRERLRQMTIRLLGHSDLNGFGKTMQSMPYRNYLYAGHLTPGKGTSILDISNPREPKTVGELPGYKNTMSPKVQIVDNLLLVNYEQRGSEKAERVGFSVFDLKDPKNPKEICFYDTGGQGVHRITYRGGRYAYVTAVPEGFLDRMLLIIDMSNPEKPEEAGRWWLPGQWTEGGETPGWPKGLKYKLHHAIPHGNRAYLGMWDGGMYILDTTDFSDIKVVSNLCWSPEEGGCTHTALPLPGRNLLIVTDESTRDRCQEPPKYVRVIDIKDEKSPQVLSKFPVPEGDYCQKGLRFGPHNLHENWPGAFQSEELIFVTYNNAGIRVVDVRDPYNPVEVDSYVPSDPPGVEAIQTTDVYVEASGVIYTTDRAGGGIHILEKID